MNSFQLLLALVILTILYSLYIVIYRVYLSPLSHIPGPKIAIATGWYECYYDVWKRGLYYRKVKEFHRKYGPIVRISPHEVHVDDAEYFDEIFNNSYKWDKYAPYMNQFNAPGAVVSTAEHDIHRVRRKAETNFFSKRSVVALEPLVHRNMEKLCARMQRFRDTQTPFPVNQAMLCFTSDVISEYAFGKSYGLLDTEDLAPLLLAANKNIGEASHMMKQWPWLVDLLNLLPDAWIGRLSANFGLMLGLQDIARRHVFEIHSGADTDAKSGHSIFHTLLNSTLSAADKDPERLAKEGFAIVAAGGDTTGSTISSLLYHLLDNPAKLARLRDELTPVFSNSASNPVTWTQLEQLPYMSAVVNEGLRMNYGISSRISRCAPDRETKYHDIVIPRGTPVSMSVPDIHDDPKIFPEPEKFSPERWLRDPIPTPPGEGKPEAVSGRLDRYLVPFAKGSRQCLGMNLAYADLFIAVATLVTRFDYELYETTRRDVDFVHDFTAPHPYLDSKFVRVLIK